MAKVYGFAHQIPNFNFKVCNMNEQLKSMRKSQNVLRLNRNRRNSRGIVSREAVPIVASASAGTIRIIIHGRHLEVTDAIREYVEKKISKALNHYEQIINIVDVHLSARGGDTGTKGMKIQKTEVTMHTKKNGILRSEVASDNLYASIDLVCDKIERKLRKIKEKTISKEKARRSKEKMNYESNIEVEEALEDVVIDEERSLPLEIVRTKFFKLEPMSAEEAALKMEQLDHSFYLFEDIKEKSIQVVYKRKERGYGVIVPLKE